MHGGRVEQVLQVVWLIDMIVLEGLDEFEHVLGCPHVLEPLNDRPECAQPPIGEELLEDQ